MFLNDSRSGRKRLRRLPNRRPTDTFVQACREADRRKVRVEQPDHIPCAPSPTVEALMYSLRERGTRALDELDTKRRLSELSDHQVVEVGNRLQKLRPEIARAWNAAEVEILFQARITNAR
jgi:hypothetical protein